MYKLTSCSRGPGALDKKRNASGKCEDDILIAIVSRMVA